MQPARTQAGPPVRPLALQHDEGGECGHAVAQEALRIQAQVVVHLQGGRWVGREGVPLGKGGGMERGLAGQAPQASAPAAQHARQGRLLGCCKALPSRGQLSQAQCRIATLPARHHGKKRTRARCSRDSASSSAPRTSSEPSTGTNLRQRGSGQGGKRGSDTRTDVCRAAFGPPAAVQKAPQLKQAQPPDAGSMQAHWWPRMDVSAASSTSLTASRNEVTTTTGACASKGQIVRAAEGAGNRSQHGQRDRGSAPHHLIELYIRFRQRPSSPQTTAAATNAARTSGGKPCSWSGCPTVKVLFMQLSRLPGSGMCNRRELSSLKLEGAWCC